MGCEVAEEDGSAAMRPKIRINIQVTTPFVFQGDLDDLTAALTAAMRQHQHDWTMQVKGKIDIGESYGENASDATRQVVHSLK